MKAAILYEANTPLQVVEVGQEGQGADIGSGRPRRGGVQLR